MLPYVHDRPENVKLVTPRRYRAVMAKKCTKKRDPVPSCFFANLNLLPFCRPCCRRRRRSLNSLLIACDHRAGL